MQSTTREYLQDLRRSPNLLLACNLITCEGLTDMYVQCPWATVAVVKCTHLAQCSLCITCATAVHGEITHMACMLKLKQSNMYRHIMNLPFCKIK